MARYHQGTDLSNIDWEALSKKDSQNERHGKHPVQISCAVSWFLNLMEFMGFTEGMCAMAEGLRSLRAV
jgi:hypothetical protein